MLRRFDGLFGMPMPYIAAWHQAPVRADRELGYLHLQLFSIRRAPDKLKYLAGSESAMGVFINDIVPGTRRRAAPLTTLPGGRDHVSSGGGGPGTGPPAGKGRLAVHAHSRRTAEN